MRRLAAQVTLFLNLPDVARKPRALRLLQQSLDGVETIDAQLGHADTANFTRTLRRWSG